MDDILDVAVPVLIVYVVLCCILLAFLSDVMGDKGYEKTGRMWFIGFVFSPVCALLYVCALPDRRASGLLELLARIEDAKVDCAKKEMPTQVGGTDA